MCVLYVLYLRSATVTFSHCYNWDMNLGVRYTPGGVWIHRIHGVSASVLDTHGYTTRIHWLDTCPQVTRGILKKEKWRTKS